MKSNGFFLRFVLVSGTVKEIIVLAVAKAMNSNKLFYFIRISLNPTTFGLLVLYLQKSMETCTVNFNLLCYVFGG